MSRATVRFRLPDGTVRELGPGDLIGRLSSAALVVDDASVSEAHAMVSLRGGELRLLALRGLFVVDEGPCNEVSLQPGMHVRLSREVAISVEAVTLPAAVLAIEGPGLPRQVLPGVASLLLGPPVDVVGRFVEGAAAWLWDTGRGWRLRVGSAEPVPLEAGARFLVGETTFGVVEVPLGGGLDATRAEGAVSAPLDIRARFDSVHLLREGHAPLVLTGQLARILSELATVGVPVAWEPLAQLAFSEATDVGDLRRRWDLALWRLRRKLREGGIRPDLVRADGAGNFELVLGAGDRVEDQT